MKLQVARRCRKARIEIVPLIDIMFFLLATFVMVSTSMIKNKGIAVNLPKAVTGATEDRADSVTLTVSKSGQYFLNKNEISPGQLALSLEALKSNNAEPKVFINGDQEASVGALVEALDQVRRAGIAKVALETDSTVRVAEGELR